MALDKNAFAAEKKFFSQPANFAHVLYIAVAALLVILIAAGIIVTWRARQAKKTPYNAHPTAEIYRSAPMPSLVAPSLVA